jgi:ABC-type Mn2+/Zn2+ transport system permease subunit
METEAANPGGTIAALFAIVALVAGLFSRRFRMAVIWSAVIGATCVALFVGILLAYAPDIQLSAAGYGRLFGYGLVAFLLGLLGHGIRKALTLLLIRRSKTQVPPQ